MQVATRNIYVLEKTLGKKKHQKKIEPIGTPQKRYKIIKQKKGVKSPPLYLISVLIELNNICINISNDIH
jgi:hypothetical protein